MKITGVRTQAYEIRMHRPIGDANNPIGSNLMRSTAMWIDTDEGVSGISMGGGSLVRSLVEELLVGKDPRGVLGHWNTMIDRVFKGGNRGEASSAIGAIDVALWDLKARLNGEPLWKTLGASSNRVKAYASGLDYPLSDRDVRSYYEGMAAKGVQGGKLKIGLDLEADIRRIGIMHDALATTGKKPELMIDVNEYWSPKQSIRYMHEIESEHDITWLEEPARRWDVNGLRKVSDNIRAAVASGENLDSLDDYVPLLQSRAVDIVNVGVGATGITGAMKVSDVAYAYETPVTMMNCPGSFMAHLAAVLPNHITMEVLNNGRDAVFTNTHIIEDGWIVLNNEPGLGFTFDQEKLKAHPFTPGEEGFYSGRRQGAGLYVAGLEEPSQRNYE